MVTKYFSTDLSSQVGKHEKIPIDQTPHSSETRSPSSIDRDHQWSGHKTKFPTTAATNAEWLYWAWRIDAFELRCWRRLESPLDCKESQPVHPKGNQSWIVIGGTDAEAETPILWPPDMKNWLIWKDPDAGKDWWWEEKGTTEGKMVGWHHQFNGHEFE